MIFSFGCEEESAPLGLLAPWHAAACATAVFWAAVFAAAAFARSGAPAPDLETVLREEDATAFRLEGDALAWRGLRVEAEALASTRRGFATSFGSCSFAEPVADLRSLGVLAPESHPTHPRGLA